MTKAETLTIPDIGDFKNIPVIEVLVSPGDEIAVDDTLIVLESDKATLDVPSAVSGRVMEVLIEVGDHVSQGAAFLVVERADDVAPSQQVISPRREERPTPAPAAPTSSTPPTIAKSSTAAIPPTNNNAPPHASPSVRRFARELGVDLTQVVGTGPKGRISKEDIQSFVKRRFTVDTASATTAAEDGLRLLPWPQVDFARFGAVERTPLSKIRRISGANLTRNSVLIPHVTNFDEADITELEAFRVTLNSENAQRGPRISILPFIIKAAVNALKQYPEFNSSHDGDDLILKRYYNIGFAADTPDGLVVPVIRNADQMGILEIATEAARLAKEAREGKLKLGDMQGASFTISSLGGVGGTNFTPIINAPEVAILGMTRAQIKPTWDGSAFQPRMIQPLSLSWDHRVVDGVAAARFLVTMCRLLSDYRRIAL